MHGVLVQAHGLQVAPSRRAISAETALTSMVTTETACSGWSVF